jgi:hypothetical protein
MDFYNTIIYHLMKSRSKKNCLALPYDLCNILYYAIVYMDFYFNINKDSTYARKYYTLVCFHPWMQVGSISKLETKDLTQQHGVDGLQVQ